MKTKLPIIVIISTIVIILLSLGIIFFIREQAFYKSPSSISSSLITSDENSASYSLSFSNNDPTVEYTAEADGTIEFNFTLNIENYGDLDRHNVPAYTDRLTTDKNFKAYEADLDIKAIYDRSSANKRYIDVVKNVNALCKIYKVEQHFNVNRSFIECNFYGNATAFRNGTVSAAEFPEVLSGSAKVKIYKNNIECIEREDCAENVLGNNFCSANDVKRHDITYSCVANKCIAADINTSIQTCSYQCSNGACITSPVNNTPNNNTPVNNTPNNNTFLSCWKIRGFIQQAFSGEDSACYLIANQTSCASINGLYSTEALCLAEIKTGSDDAPTGLKKIWDDYGVYIIIASTLLVIIVSTLTIWRVFYKKIKK